MDSRLRGNDNLVNSRLRGNDSLQGNGSLHGDDKGLS